jgi:high-affinity Fe2+/Pb2+ permease
MMGVTMGNISGKVYGAGAGVGVAGALTTIIVAILNGRGIQVSNELATAITTVIAFAGAIAGSAIAPHTSAPAADSPRSDAPHSQPPGS